VILCVLTDETVLENANSSVPALVLDSAGYHKREITRSLLCSDETSSSSTPLSPSKHKMADKLIEVLSPEFDLSLISDSHAPKDLLQLEVEDPAKKFCFDVGVLFSRRDQSLERDMFDNEHGSPEFNEFMEIIGDKITLQGWSGYRGGLDVQNNSKGPVSFYTEWQGLEIMYHVSTLLPYNPQDPDKLSRSGVLRNDIAIIVFREFGGTPYPPASIRSKLNHIVLVVSALPKTSAHEETKYLMSAVSRPEVVPFAPTLHYPPIFSRSEIKDYMLTKVINGVIASQRTESFDVAFKGPRRANIAEFFDKYAKKRNRKSSVLSHLNNLLPRGNSREENTPKRASSASVDITREKRTSSAAGSHPTLHLSSGPITPLRGSGSIEPSKSETLLTPKRSDESKK